MDKRQILLDAYNMIYYYAKEIEAQGYADIANHIITSNNDVYMEIEKLEQEQEQ